MKNKMYFDELEFKPKQFVVEGESGVCLADYETQKYLEFFGFEQGTDFHSKDEGDQEDAMWYGLKILFYPSDGIYDEYELECTVYATRYWHAPKLIDPFEIRFYKKTTEHTHSEIYIDTYWNNSYHFELKDFMWKIEDTITNLENVFDLVAMPNKFCPDPSDEELEQFNKVINQEKGWLSLIKNGARQ